MRSLWGKNIKTWQKVPLPFISYIHPCECMTYPSEAQKTMSGETKLKTMNNCYVRLIKKDAEWQSLESVCNTSHKNTKTLMLPSLRMPIPLQSMIPLTHYISRILCFIQIYIPSSFRQQEGSSCFPFRIRRICYVIYMLNASKPKLDFEPVSSSMMPVWDTGVM